CAHSVCADVLVFDWVTVAEPHYPGFSLPQTPMVMAGALSQLVRRAKIAVLGPPLPILNPVRVAEELAMLDTMSGGRVVAGMMRGTPNEYVTYNINPSESRERFAEAMHLIRRAWTETRPFGWLGRYYQYRTISIWPRRPKRPRYRVRCGAGPPAGDEVRRHDRMVVHAGRRRDRQDARRPDSTQEFRHRPVRPLHRSCIIRGDGVLAGDGYLSPFSVLVRISSTVLDIVMFAIGEDGHLMQVFRDGGVHPPLRNRKFVSLSARGDSKERTRL